jgi:alanine dehydrogenase
MRRCSDHLSFPTVAGGQRQVKHYLDNKYANGLARVCDVTQNRLVAIIADGWFSLLRVGGTSALGTKFLANPDVKEVGLLGSGWQARGLVMGLKIVLPSLKRIRVFSPNTSNRVNFADQMTTFLGISVEPVASADEAMKDIDIIATATSSMKPVIEDRWLRKGIHIVAGAHACEVPDLVIRKADVAVIAQREVGIEPRSPDFDALISKKQMVLQGEIQEKRPVDWSQFVLLCDLVAGKTRGRKSGEEKTLMINNFGLGTQYAALGALVYKIAKQRGVGKTLPYDWFLSEYTWDNPGTAA